jgi:hypothetical protein
MLIVRPLSLIEAAATSALALGMWAGFASAAELSREKIMTSSDVAHCGVYGPGYVRVEGTYACARIGERMRVEMQVNRAPPFLGGFAPLNDLGPADGATRAHLRLDNAPLPADRSVTR